jgi:hypothetical protein
VVLKQQAWESQHTFFWKVRTTVPKGSHMLSSLCLFVCLGEGRDVRKKWTRTLECASAPNDGKRRSRPSGRVRKTAFLHTSR